MSDESHSPSNVAEVVGRSQTAILGAIYAAARNQPERVNVWFPCPFMKTGVLTRSG